MNKKNYIDKIELILNTSGKYITRKERDMILDYVNYFKTKNNVIEDKNIELVIEIERLNKKLENLEELNNANYQSFIETNNIIVDINKILNDDDLCHIEKLQKINKALGSDKE